MSAVVHDPFCVTADAKMSFLAASLDPAQAERELRQACTRSIRDAESLRIRAIRVTRYKPGRRCLIEYDVATATGGPITLIGKARAKGADSATFALMQNLRRTGFDDFSRDGISVPEPVGLVPAFGMWLQRKVPGVPATQNLTSDRGVTVAVKIADAVHKLHEANVPTKRRHTTADEMGILTDGLAALGRTTPAWSQRLDRLLDNCRTVANELSPSTNSGIHRDFYPDQVLVSESRLYLLDFDLYCAGHPALDAGNFVGHLTEQALRSCASADALNAAGAAFTERFSRLSANAAPREIQACALLTLVRHVALSLRFPERQPWTLRLLELCEDQMKNRKHRLAHRDSNSRFLH